MNLTEKLELAPSTFGPAHKIYGHIKKLARSINEAEILLD